MGGQIRVYAKIEELGLFVFPCHELHPALVDRYDSPVGEYNSGVTIYGYHRGNCAFEGSIEVPPIIIIGATEDAGFDPEVSRGEERIPGKTGWRNHDAVVGVYVLKQFRECANLLHSNVSGVVLRLNCVSAAQTP